MSAVKPFTPSWIVLFGLVLSGQASVSAAHISGKVEILDKSDVTRKVIQDVLVYVTGVEAPIPESARDQRFSIQSENKTFLPRVAAVPLGAAVSFPNRDPIMHNVFSLSRGNRFDLGLYKAGASKDHRFQTPGLVRVYCNIHPHMSAYLWVMEHPYYTWARSDGSFRIDGVPPGTYVVKAWHEQAEAELEVTLGESGTHDLRFVLDARRFKETPHLNKFGKPYQTRPY